jgi:nicotinate-nucleotide adenylyltransferase
VRIGLLGGSFDPPHNGHLLAAGDAFEALGLDRLIFIPAAVQPLKGGQMTAAAAQRLRMVQLLVENDARFAVDSVEIDRGGLSFMVDTLTTLAARWPDAERFLLVGADVPVTFAKWRDPQRIAELATLVVLQRGTGAGNGRLDLSGMPAATKVLATRRIDISSTEIRQRVHEGRSIRGFVPDAVAEFISAERLYR